MRKLLASEHIPSRLGVRVGYHSIKKGGQDSPPTSLVAGGRISFHEIPGETTGVHSQDFAELILVIGGRILHSVNAETQHLEPGSLVFVRPGDEHCFRLLDSDCEMLNLSFDYDLILRLVDYLGDDAFVDGFRSPRIPPKFTLSIAEADLLASEMLKINSTANESLAHAAAIAKALIARIFATYFTSAPGHPHDSEAPEWLGRVCREMRLKRNCSAGLPALRKLAPCSMGHLCKSFRRHLGKTPTQFVNELRAMSAAALLADTSQPIYAIAVDLGFESLSRFYHIFKKHYGISPALYRTRMRHNDIPLTAETKKNALRT